jgi:regulatory protein YycH of two-component signal transduction system YycFG
VSWSESVVHIGLSQDKKFLVSQLTDIKTQKEIQKHIQDWTGKTLAIKVEATENAPLSIYESQQKKSQEERNALKKEVESHPFVIEAKKTFPGEIQSIRELS